MLISDEFPSKYLKSSDLKGREVRVTMASVERELIGADSKVVLYFKDKDKGMVLNKTNSYTISDAYGDDTDDWRDQPLILFSIRTEFQGKAVDGLRCRVPTAKDNRPVPKEDPISSGPIAPPRRPVGGGEMPNDDIPFAAEFR